MIHESHLNKGNMLDFCNLLRRVDAAGVILLNRTIRRGPESDTDDRTSGTML